MLCTPYPAIFCIWNLHSLAPEHTDYGFLQVYLLYSGRLSEKKLGYVSYFLRQNHMDFISILRNVNDQGLPLNPRVTYSNVPSCLLLPIFLFSQMLTLNKRLLSSEERLGSMTWMHRMHTAMGLYLMASLRPGSLSQRAPALFYMYLILLLQIQELAPAFNWRSVSSPQSLADADQMLTGRS